MGRTVDEPTDSGLRSVLCAWRSEAGAQPDAVLGIIIVFPHMVKKAHSRGMCLWPFPSEKAWGKITLADQLSVFGEIKAIQSKAPHIAGFGITVSSSWML